jgi:hypothetical protein
MGGRSLRYSTQDRSARDHVEDYASQLQQLRRSKPNARVVAFVSAEPLEELYVSSVTFAEIRFGIEVVDDAARRAELNHGLAHRVRPMFVTKPTQVVCLRGADGVAQAAAS